MTDFISKKEVEHAYLEVSVPEPYGFNQWEAEKQLEYYRTELKALQAQIKRHTDADGSSLCLTTVEVCVFCGTSSEHAMDDDGDAVCCDRQCAGAPV